MGTLYLYASNPAFMYISPHERQQCLVSVHGVTVTQERPPPAMCQRDASINIDKLERDLLTRLTLTSGFKGIPLLQSYL